MSDATTPRPGPTLATSMSAAFHPSQTPESFAEALARLAQALTSAASAHVGLPGQGALLASSPADAPLPNHIADWLADIAARDPADTEVAEDAGALAIPIALPGGGTAGLLVRLQASGNAARALAYERLVGLSKLSVAMYRHPDVTGLTSILAALQNTDPDLETLATDIRALVDADQVAIMRFDGETIADVAFSDQPRATTRASLPDRLRGEFTAALKTGTTDPDIHVGGRGGNGVVLKAEGARRNTLLLPVLTTALAEGSGLASAKQNRRRTRLVRWASAALVILALGMIPLPDARRATAEVISTNARMVTAPFSGIVLEVDVSANDAVLGGQTLLFRLDAGEITQELASTQAEYARALLERESARGARDAAALRNAELEVERLRAKTDLLEARRASAQVLAPIDGVVVAEDLDGFRGATVRQGDMLLQVVNPGNLALRLEVPDDLLARLDDDEIGQFRPDFDPSQSFESQITRISPAQSQRQNVSVFDGRATLPEDTMTLRPGLRGVFAFERQFRPLWQIIWTAGRNWVLLRLWL